MTRDMQNPDLLMPPSTDHGTLPNLRFSFSDLHMWLVSLNQWLALTPSW
jgi:oxalate decarboxylase